MSQRRNYLRWQEKKILQAMQSIRVIVLAGARQCGKTTLAKLLVKKVGATYRTLDDVNLLNSAKSDPSDFIKHQDKLMIIDEIQRVPDLLLAIKKEVDENPKKGRFLLTGSANIQSSPYSMESLAGRVSRLRLRPLSLGEIHQANSNFITKAFKEKFNQTKTNLTQSILDKNEIIKLLLKGGYPEAIKLKKDSARKKWHRDYIDALIEKDLKDIAQIRRKDSMKKLIYLLASFSSTIININSITQAISVQRKTIESYISALESLYLIERLQSFQKTEYARVKKQEKIYFTDSGLMASLLGWNFEKIRYDGDKNGKIFETYIFNELKSILEAQNELGEIYYYRDREKREVDFVIENDEGKLLAIEAKFTSTINLNHFKHLKWFKQNIAKDRDFIGVVIYTGKEKLSFGDKLWAVPFSYLIN